MTRKAYPANSGYCSAASARARRFSPGSISIDCMRTSYLPETPPPRLWAARDSESVRCLAKKTWFQAVAEAAIGYASCFLPAFLAAAHLFFIASASRFRPAELIAPRRGAAVPFDVVPARFAAQRLLVASMILLRPSGLRCLLRGWPLLLGDVTFAKGLFPATSRRADMARSMADRCVSS
jgi:hypothetical protein